MGCIGRRRKATGRPPRRYTASVLVSPCRRPIARIGTFGPAALPPGARTLRIGETIRKVVDDAGEAQARLLLAALYEQVADISQNLESAELRG
jgi:hypothetical protein